MSRGHNAAAGRLRCIDRTVTETMWSTRRSLAQTWHRGHRLPGRQLPATVGSSSRCREAGSREQELFELGQWQRRAEVVALDLVALVAPEERQLGGRLDAFGDDLQVEAVAHLDDCQSDGGVVGVVGDLADEAEVDLELVDGEPAQVGQAGVPGPEVVDGDLHPDGFEVP